MDGVGVLLGDKQSRPGAGTPELVSLSEEWS